MSQIKLIITDFDGTLVDTFSANLKAYQQSFSSVGLSLSEDQYKKCFGLRFERFMQAMNIDDNEIAKKIRQFKSEFYPKHFDLLKVNKSVLNFIRYFRANGVKTSVASTARRKNLVNALTHIGAINDFDLILAGEDVTNGKPNPEIYNIVMRHFNASPNETLIFEDSQVGIDAAHASNANYMRIYGINN